MQTDLFNTDIHKGAVFSECRKYRYALWRIWDKGTPPVMFIGLNPSTANELTDDPTIRRVITFAKSWGYGGVYMLNLFAYVSSKPEALKSVEDPVGENDKWLKGISELCQGQVICAWGNFKEAVERAKKVKTMFRHKRALFINNNGSPKHPLYVPGNCEPVNFD